MKCKHAWCISICAEMWNDITFKVVKSSNVSQTAKTDSPLEKNRLKFTWWYHSIFLSYHVHVVKHSLFNRFLYHVNLQFSFCVVSLHYATDIPFKSEIHLSKSSFSCKREITRERKKNNKTKHYNLFISKFSYVHVLHVLCLELISTR